MRNWNRKCGNYGQLGHFDSSYGQLKLGHFNNASGQVDNCDGSTNNNSTAYRFNSLYHLKSLILGHAEWIKSYLDDGWDGYLVTLMFNSLAGKRDTKIIQMHQEITKFYGRLATRMIRKPRSSKWAKWLPNGIFIPDMPVPKSRRGQKSTVADVSINDGYHVHGILLGNRWGRLHVPLDQYFEENAGKYLDGKIRHIDVQRITHDPGYVVDYALKGLLRRTASNDDILVLNWGGMRLD
jgi:hypothetical protein